MQSITVILLCAPEALTLAQQQLIAKAEKIFLQTFKHPSAETVQHHIDEVQSMDDLL